MIIYIDVLFINNLLMTLAIIWAVGHLLEYKIKWFRLILASLIGTVYSIIFFYCYNLNWPAWIIYIWYIAINIITALFMIRVAFGKMSRIKLFKSVIYLYLVSFITIGTTMSIFYINGGSPFNSKSEYTFIILGFIILIIIAKYGYGIFQRYITPEIFFMPLKIFYNQKYIELIGLLDTGNKLNDPLTNVPVIVTDLKSFNYLFSNSIREKIIDDGKEVMELINIFNDNGLGNRVRILPFSDLGQEHGILLGFRPDKIQILYKDKKIETERVVIALSKKKLDEEDKYQAIINPQLLKQY